MILSECSIKNREIVDVRDHSKKREKESRAVHIEKRFIERRKLRKEQCNPYSSSYPLREEESHIYIDKCKDPLPIIDSS